jgi:hypothetical protein
MRQGMLRSGVLSPGRCPWAGAVRACGDPVRAGWLVLQAIVDCGAGGRAGLMPEDAWFRQPGFQAHSRPYVGSIAHVPVARRASINVTKGLRRKKND